MSDVNSNRSNRTIIDMNSVAVTAKHNGSNAPNEEMEILKTENSLNALHHDYGYHCPSKDTDLKQKSLNGTFGVLQNLHSNSKFKLPLG